MHRPVFILLCVLVVFSGHRSGAGKDLSADYDPVLMSRYDITCEELDKAPPAFRDLFLLRHPAPYVSSVSTGTKSRDDWQAIIDSTWGSGLPDLTKISIFNSYWNQVDQKFACFQDLDLDWDSVSASCSQELQAGVSRGRFSAMLNHATASLMESHSQTSDDDVTYTTLEPGVPLLLVGGWGPERHFGAGLTPQEDSTLLVYRVGLDHPLGLVPGDIVLGYDDTPWKDLYPQLLDAQLPIGNSFWWGSSPEAFGHAWLVAAGLNWHLFDTIDIVRYATGDTDHLPTSLLEGQTPYVDAREQMDIPGVSRPEGDQTLTWGIVEGTQIGYIYCIRWTEDAGAGFYNAVDSLMTHFNPIGIILDQRCNFGGGVFPVFPALNKLFYTTEETIGFSHRCPGGGHDDLCVAYGPEWYTIEGDPDGGFRKPIAVLTGPGAVSAGDQIPLYMTFHPNCRTFGKPTSAAFNSLERLNLYGGFRFSLATAESYLAANPGHYLTHDYIPVDEPVWLTPDGVAEGRDDVVEAAMTWIYEETGCWFLFDTVTGSAPLQVSFSGESPLPVIDWTWDFGDGDSAFVQNPQHLYSQRGLYDVCLRVEAPDTVRTHVERACIAVLADTLFSDTIHCEDESGVVVTVHAQNMLPLSKMSLPVEYAGTIDLHLDSFSIAGCRTESLGTAEYTHYSSSGHRASIDIDFPADTSGGELPPGSGPVLKLFFTPTSGVVQGAETAIELDGYLMFEPVFTAKRATYSPIPISGMVWYPACCRGVRGNVDFDPEDVIDISDLVYLVDYMFADGPDPLCPEEANVDGDFMEQIDISDLVYLVDYMFAAGPDPFICF